MKSTSLFTLGLCAWTISLPAMVQAEEVTINFSLTPYPFHSKTTNLEQNLELQESSNHHLLTTQSISIEKPKAIDVATNYKELEAKSSHFHDLFTGEEESLVARAVGSAEGTRTPEGHRTLAYYGHQDPGNGVWNLGSFSYQHGASSPEDADTRQLKRLKAQAETLQQQAIEQSITLTSEEMLNGIDLANQSPQAALEQGGYIDQLHQAQQTGLKGSAAILQARVQSFFDPNTQRWDAPGLGNNLHRISQDQSRRMAAIARALATYHQHFVTTRPANQINQNPPPPPQTHSAPPSLEERADQLIWLDLSENW